jgi:hypothetical protein
MSQSATELPYEHSECEAFGIETERIMEGYPPKVKGSQAALLCTFAA